MYELITIAFSHYCEKARWALDLHRVPYRERRYLPAMHMLATRRALRGTDAGQADRVSSRFSTPILLGDGAPITDSTDIARRFAPELFTDPEAVRLDRYFSDELGGHTRRIAYWFCLEEPAILHGLARDNVSAPQAWLLRAAFPFVAGVLRKNLKVDRAGYERSLDKARAVIDEAGELLSDGRRYLVGDRFTAADLALATMMAPAIMPPPESFGAVLPQPEGLSLGPRALVEEMRAHPAGAFAMRMFAEERWPRG
ncbi:MAG: glutathione S-transferase C-terminal domain-containing protein [Sandaracinaceae bacterium]|nr:glutathione S-transferase C-terminal domain-containing protein [Sandaracinaceae bacterium]